MRRMDFSGKEASSFQFGAPKQQIAFVQGSGSEKGREAQFLFHIAPDGSFTMEQSVPLSEENLKGVIVHTREYADLSEQEVQKCFNTAARSIFRVPWTVASGGCSKDKEGFLKHSQLIPTLSEIFSYYLEECGVSFTATDRSELFFGAVACDAPVFEIDLVTASSTHCKFAYEPFGGLYNPDCWVGDLGVPVKDEVAQAEREDCEYARRVIFDPTFSEPVRAMPFRSVFIFEDGSRASAGRLSFSHIA